jgi:adenine-specific DNA-methyltransferase
MTKEEAKLKIAELVKKYEGLSARELNQYSHNEEATKLNFIMPLFTALGWDFQNNNEVTAEEKASNGRVDYAFKLKNVTQLCLEAKPLKADINSENYKKQAIDYAYYKAVTWAALTNFEELRLFNAQKKDNFITLTHDKYIQEFDDLWLFSKESFETGLLKAKATKYGVLSPPPRIETLLYTDLREWRGQLYNQLHQHNASLKSYEIDEVIQKFFNRLIFIRTCEDKGLESNQLLETVREWGKGGHKGELVEKVKQIFQKYNGWYDSELFDTHLLDSDKVFIEGLTVENILKGMANYAFDLIDADVLGAVYEQYLGFVAAEAKEKPQEQQKMALGLSGDSTFTIVNKKQHRKEQGIYYTPRFVTDYIVKETVGRFVKEHNANEIFNIKILDPACGSGSFLIRAYDELLTHYADDRQKTVAQLNQNDRLPVLKRNIFGVDLDRQAVEIARLNLLIRSLAHREILPGLKDNIKQGNSLISGTPEELEKYFGKTYENKRPFDWKNQFSEIVDNGGFDIVIGNPPYVQFSMDKKTSSFKDYLIDKFGSSMGRLNTFGFFIHRGISLLQKGGYLGYIIPNTFLTQQYYTSLRQFVLDTCEIVSIATLEEMPFPSAVIENVVIILKKQESNEIREHNTVKVKELGEESEHIISQIDFRKTFNSSFTISLSDNSQKFSEKIVKQSLKLNELVFVNQAIALAHDRKSSLFKEPIDGRYKKVLDGRDINRYVIDFSNTYLLFDLSKIHSCKREDIFLANEKLLFRRVGDSIIAAYDNEQYYALNTLVVITPKIPDINLKFILGILNSNLINSYYKLFLKSTKKVFSEIQARQVGQLPIRKINFDNPGEKLFHDQIVTLVDKMIELNKKLLPIRDIYSFERDDLIKEIENTDKEIDNLVYDLYGLTAEERKIVEEEIK